MNKLLMAAMSATAVLLHGCGGGGSENNQETQGFWQGTADNGRTA